MNYKKIKQDSQDKVNYMNKGINVRYRRLMEAINNDEKYHSDALSYSLKSSIELVTNIIKHDKVDIDTNIQNVSYYCVTIKSDVIYDNKYLIKDIQITNVDFVCCEIKNVVFENVVFENVIFNECNFGNSVFSNCNIVKTSEVTGFLSNDILFGIALVDSYFDSLKFINLKNQDLKIYLNKLCGDEINFINGIQENTYIFNSKIHIIKFFDITLYQFRIHDSIINFFYENKLLVREYVFVQCCSGRMLTQYLDFEGTGLGDYAKVYEKPLECITRINKISSTNSFEYEQIYLHKSSMAKERFFSLDGIVQNIAKLTCGFGERPSRAIITIIIGGIFFSILYMITGVQIDAEIVRYRISIHNCLSFKEWINVYSDYLHFSIVTLTTVGYGNAVPIGWISKMIANFEMIFGIIMVALYTGTLFRKITR